MSVVTVVRRARLDLSAVLLLGMHLAVFAALFVHLTWGVAALAVGGYVLRMFAITAGYHRYFSHRAFKTSRAFQLVLATLGTASMQNGPLWWASWHRRHHKYADTPLDPHSPAHVGFWRAHLGWVLEEGSEQVDVSNIKDLTRFPELRFLERHKWLPIIGYALGCLLIAGWSGVVWGFVVSTIVLFHATLLINSLAHVWGTRRYATSDTSRNNPWLAVITLGEGWHNNHHHFMSSARQGFFWWEIDVSYYALCLLRAVGIVWDVRAPSPDVVGTSAAARGASGIRAARRVGRALEMAARIPLDRPVHRPSQDTAETTTGKGEAMVRRYRNLVELGEESCRTFASRPLFGTRSKAGYTWTTYGQFQALVDALRGGLADLGVKQGDKVAIVSNNRVEWAVAAYATYGLGACFVPMYEAQRADEWEFILADCGAQVVFGSNDAVVSALDAMQPRLPELTRVIGIERPLNGKDSYAGLLERGRLARVPSMSPEPSSVAGFVYTSGTTGKPKGVMLTHDNFTSNIHAGTTVFPVTPDDVTLSFLPWAHVYGQAIELHLLVSVGASTAFVTDVTKLVQELADVRPTMLIAVPRIFNRIYASVNQQLASKPRFVRSLVRTALRTAARKRQGQPVGPLDQLAYRLADRLVFAKVRARFGGRLKYALSASAALSVEVAEFVDAIGIEVYEGYGLTETSPVVTGNYPGTRKIGSVGKPIPGVTVTIDRLVGDDASGRGEIVVHGPNVMLGYHNRPIENATAMLADHGFRTGDLGFIDEDGFLFVTGRIKEQYKLESGKYVMPAPLEEALKLSPYILNVMLYGANKPFNTAVLVLDGNAIRTWADENQVQLGSELAADPKVSKLIRDELDRCGASFRRFEKPAGVVLTVEDFTIDSGLLTPTLKLKRGAVIDRYKERLEKLYLSAPVALETALA